METTLNLRIDQLKGKHIAIICTDRNDLDYMVSLLNYDAKLFSSITSFPMAISAEIMNFCVALSHNTYVFVSATAVKFANDNTPRIIAETTPPKGIFVTSSIDNPTLMTALIHDLTSLGFNVPTDNEDGNVKTIFSYMQNCFRSCDYKILNTNKEREFYPRKREVIMKFVIPEDYNKVLDHVKQALAYYEAKEEAKKVLVIGNGSNIVTVTKNGVIVDNKTIPINQIQDLVNKLTNHTFPWVVTVDYLSIGCFKNITIKDLQTIIETYNELNKK
jgi:hypothetical protein